jgi:precorrin-2 dehydrogenase/sirohydrochlorin ferrochelatase
MKLLPVALRVENQRITIVGGGAVAARKARALLECGARVKIISPQLCDELKTQLEQPSPCWEYSQRAFQSDDCDGCILVFACTNDSQVNAQIAAICGAKNILCQVADDGAGSTLHSAAAIRRGAICIGVSTEGASPALAKFLKEKIEDCIGEEYSQLSQWMGERRESLKTKMDSQAERAAIWRAVLDSGVLPLLREGKPDEAAKLLGGIIHSAVEIQNSQSS